MSGSVQAEILSETRCHYRVPHVRFIVRSRALWQAGRCASVVPSLVVTWLLRVAPLWVVVRVSELLRKRRSEWDADDYASLEVGDDASSASDDDFSSEYGTLDDVWSEQDDDDDVLSADVSSDADEDVVSERVGQLSSESDDDVL